MAQKIDDLEFRNAESTNQNSKGSTRKNSLIKNLEHTMDDDNQDERKILIDEY